MIETLRGFFAVYPEHWHDWATQLWPSILVTIGLTASAFLVAVVLGLLLALGKLSRLRPCRHPLRPT
jgi:ABC-type amino acid transport system permease subunit